MGGGLLPSLQSAPPSPPRVRSVVTFRGEEEAKELLSPSSLPSSAPSSALTSLDSAVRRYAAVRSAKAVSSVRLSALLDERRRGPFTSQTLHVAPLAASASLASSTSSLQPAWNGGEAYDWNERLPYPGVDALAEHLRGGDEAKGPLSPSTVSYHRHIRRASLDGRTGGRLWEVENARLKLERQRPEDRPTADFFFHGLVRQQHLVAHAPGEEEKQRRDADREKAALVRQEERRHRLAQQQRTQWNTQWATSSPPLIETAHCPSSASVTASTFSRVILGVDGPSSALSSHVVAVAPSHRFFHVQSPNAAGPRYHRLATEFRGRRDAHLINHSANAADSGYSPSPQILS